MPSSKVNVARDTAHAIDSETQAVLDNVKKKNTRAVTWFIVSWTLLFVLGVAGIYRQNQIATANKKHIDCIVKLFTTPLPTNAHSRTLSNPSTTCNITFTR